MTDNSSYWGNPPQTPVSKNAPGVHGQPVPPYYQTPDSQPNPVAQVPGRITANQAAVPSVSAPEQGAPVVTPAPEQSAAFVANVTQTAQAPTSDGWTCTCGNHNVGKFCTECGTPQPEAAPEPEQAVVAEPEQAPQPASEPVSEPATEMASAPVSDTAPEATFAATEPLPQSGFGPDVQGAPASMSTPAVVPIPGIPAGSVTDPRAVDNAQYWNSTQPMGAAQQPYGAQSVPPWQTPGAMPSIAPAPQKQKNNTKKIVLIVLGVFIAFAVLISAGIGIVVAKVAEELEPGISTPSYLGDNQLSSSNSATSEEGRNEAFRCLYDLSADDDSASLTRSEILSVEADIEDDGKSADATYAPGVYEIGVDIEPGQYWFYGNEKHISFFAVLEPTSSGATTYDTKNFNTYYGHNIAELKKGSFLVVDNTLGFTESSKIPTPRTLPVGSGVYRVGVDIPAGDYVLTAGPASDDMYGYYIMNDLKYNNSSYVDVEYSFDSDIKFTISLKDGQYLELYNMKGSQSETTPVSSSGSLKA